MTAYANVEGMTDSMPSGDTLWTADEVARYCRVSRSMIYKLSQSGELPSLHIGSCLRYDPDTVRKWVRGELVGLPEGKILRMRRHAA